MSDAPGQTWDDAGKLLRSDELHEILRQRLVQLAMTADNATAIRAIEMIFNAPRSYEDEILRDVPTDVLRAARAQLATWMDQKFADYPNRGNGGSDGLPE